MSADQVYQPLSPDNIKAITDSIEIGYELISVTLISGDELIGGLAKHWGWNGKEVSIGFNAHTGQIFGESYAVEIPLELIADIKPIPLSDESIPLWSSDDPYLVRLREIEMDKSFDKRLFVQDYPNPWATIIEDHNFEVCKQLGLATGGCGEWALSRESVPPDGIKFNKDFVLYVDWDFFSRQIHGPTTMSVTLGPAGVAKDLSPSLQAFAFKHLRDNFGKIKQVQDALIPVGFEDVFIEGCILMPNPAQDTEIEGERWILMYCANIEKTGKNAYPVLVKQKALKYPLEFLGLVNSPLIFYGELLPFPIDVLGTKHDYIVLARAIGYLQS